MSECEEEEGREAKEGKKRGVCVWSGAFSGETVPHLPKDSEKILQPLKFSQQKDDVGLGTGTYTLRYRKP